ncbi:MAG: cob(I)yrinic acid a,c-diamide adenosyltransferase [Thermoplasmata archaeon]|nr:cob(I)yrinic acid a,c-diamide adenosyltransferase [Thermoplasmata archaeon]
MAYGGPIPTARLYTRTGDNGTTGLVGGTRVAKESPRIEAFGSFDELNAHLGRAAAFLPEGAASHRELLVRLQHELFLAAAELASPPGSRRDARTIGPGHVERLEHEIDRLTAEIPPQRSFVLPRGGTAATEVHVARTVARRAERALWALHRVEPQRETLLAWTNRLSDLLFALALAINRELEFVELPPDYSV